jgi:dethiobiotin synthetase
MTRRLIVLGTGTHVGKTHVTCALARSLRALGGQLLAVKPVETGYRAASSDALALADAAGHPLVPPFRAYAEPISPHLAARRAHDSIAAADIKQWLSTLYDATLHYVIVETAGGALSPLGPLETNAELARELGPAAIVLVAADRLGVLHDVTAVLSALEARGVQVDHVVLSQVPPADASTGDNAAELERLGIARVSAVVGSEQLAPALAAELT